MIVRDILQQLYDEELKDLSLHQISLNVRYNSYISEQERQNKENLELQYPLNPNFPPKFTQVEIFSDKESR